MAMAASIHKAGRANAGSPQQGKPSVTGNLFDALDAAGLVGCIKGPTDLATHHSKYLKGRPRATKKAVA
jgi:hypothetical protein